MKKKTFLPYTYWPLIIIALMFVLMMMLGAIVGLIGFFVVAADNIWAALFVFAGAILMLFAAAWLGCCIFMEMSVAMCPISIDEEGVTLGLFKRRSYPWAELSQFGIALLNPPPRNHPHPKLNQEIRPRSIYMVFGLPGEEPASAFHISRMGAMEFAQRCRFGQKVFFLIETVICLGASPKNKMRQRIDDEYLKGVYFPKRFVAMKYSPQRHMLLRSYMPQEIREKE